MQPRRAENLSEPDGRQNFSLDYQRFAETRLERAPFDHLIVPGFLRPQACDALDAGFPEIGRGGSFPADSLDCGPAFAAFVEELRGPELTRAVAAKFDIDLSGRPVMVTLRGQSRAKDGRIHTDSAAKMITALIYMNPDWEAAEGRLRLLRGPDDIEDYLAEVPPVRGTLLAFRCGPNAYHGHKPFVGQRRSVQVNWMTDAAVMKRELGRHGFSAWIKRRFGFGAGAG
jgi:hypothetical protein